MLLYCFAYYQFVSVLKIILLGLLVIKNFNILLGKKLHHFISEMTLSEHYTVK